MLRVSLLAALAVSLACSSSDGATTDQLVADESNLGKADGAPELEVRVGETSLWLRSSLDLDGDDLVLRGRTSRNLVDGNAFVFDDPYGDYATLSARKFAITWPTSTARGLLDGVDLFVGLELVHSPTRPDHLTSHVVVRPRLQSFAGSSEVYLVATLTPVLASGRAVYRLLGSATSHVFSVSARAGDGDLGTGRVHDDDRHFELDLEPSVALELIHDAMPLTLAVQLEQGSVEKHATLGAAVHEVGLTDGDPSEVWPSTCKETVLDCLTSVAPGTQDLATCGDVMTVRACSSSIGTFVGPEEIEGLVAEVDARLAESTGFAADAAALVGSDRVDTFVVLARERIIEDVQSVHGRWFVDMQARDAALDAVLEAAFDQVYAFPLLGFAPRAPVPGDEVATRQVAADALLAYLAQQDYFHSEFGRSYTDLAHEFRSQHIASLRFFRQEASAEDYPGMPTHVVYIGGWLGAYTEIALAKATGEVTSVYVELD